MKIKIYLFYVIIFHVIFANGQKIDTIKVTKDIRVNLFFPSNINNVLKGSKYLIFSIDETNPTNFGSVTIAPGKISNLTIITADNYVYSFIIKYDNNVKTLNYFIQKKDAVNNLTINDDSTKIDKNLESKKYNIKSKAKQTLYNTDTEAYYKRICLHLTSNDITFKRKYTKVDGLTFRLRDIAYNNNELYFVMSLKNNTSITYEVNFVKFYLSTIKKKKKSGIQDIELEPKFIYHKLDKVKPNDEKIFIYVIDKLTINKNKKLVIEINEKNGERNLRLDISNIYLNNASNIN